MDTYERIRGIVSAHITAPATLDTQLFDDFDAYRLDDIILVEKLESEFGVLVSDDHARRMKTVRDAVRIIDVLIAAGPKAARDSAQKLTAFCEHMAADLRSKDVEARGIAFLGPVILGDTELPDLWLRLDSFFARAASRRFNSGAR